MKLSAAKHLVIATVAIGTIASCSSENDDGPRADLTSALAGNPGPATVTAIQALERGVTIAHWSYLMGAEWPDDPSRVIADPWLRDAMSVLATTGGQSRPASFGGLGPRQWGPAPGYGSYDPAQLSATHAEAVAAMRRQNGNATLRTPAAVAEYVRTMTHLVETTSGAQLPAPTTPADEFTGVCVIEFYKGGSNSSQTCSTKPLCCRGSIDYKTGISVCYDNTSCKGKGLPTPPAGSTLGSGGSSGSTTPTSSKPVATCKDFESQRGLRPNMSCDAEGSVCNVYKKGEVPAGAHCSGSPWMNPDGSYNGPLIAEYYGCCEPA